MVLSAIPRSSSFFRSLTDLFVVLNHAGAVDIDLGTPLIHGLLDVLLGYVRPDVHPGGVEPDEERLVVLDAAVDELLGRLEELRVHGLHALAGQRAGVLTALLAHRAELRIFGGVVLSVAQQCSTPRGPNFSLNAGFFTPG